MAGAVDLEALQRQVSQQHQFKDGAGATPWHVETVQGTVNRVVATAGVPAAESSRPVLLHSGPLPTQRRNAIHYKYSEDASVSMQTTGTMIQPPREDKIASSTYRDMYSLPTDSWEVENCVGMAIEQLLKPRWREIKQCVAQWPERVPHL